jgi:hypothetical protein
MIKVQVVIDDTMPGGQEGPVVASVLEGRVVGTGHTRADEFVVDRREGLLRCQRYSSSSSDTGEVTLGFGRRP